jgi:hypothetical protein
VVQVVDGCDNRHYGAVDSNKLGDEFNKMTIEIRARETREEERIACMRNEHVKEMERLARDLRGQAAQREKALKEDLEAVGREQRQRLTDMLIEQGRRIDKNREQQFRRASEAKTRRNEALPAIPADCGTKMSHKVEVEAELKQRSAQALETREKRLKVAEKVRSR